MSLPTNIPDFPDRLFVDLAIGTLSFEDTCWANGVDPTAVKPWEGDPDFQHKLLAAKQAVEDDGRAFRARCRALAQDNVHHIAAIISDKDVTAGHRVDAFKTVAKLGELEPKETGGPGTGAMLNLTIIAPGGQAVQVVRGKPTIEGEVEPESGDLDGLPTLDAEDFAWVESPMLGA